MQFRRCKKKCIHFGIVEKFYTYKKNVKQNQCNDTRTTQTESLKVS